MRSDQDRGPSNQARSKGTSAVRSAQELRARLCPQLTDSECEELITVIRDAQLRPPDGAQDRVEFVANINYCLVTHALRLRTSLGLASLTIKNGCIQFIVAGFGSCGFQNHALIAVERVSPAYGRANSLSRLVTPTSLANEKLPQVPAQGPAPGAKKRRS